MAIPFTQFSNRLAESATTAAFGMLIDISIDIDCLHIYEVGSDHFVEKHMREIARSRCYVDKVCFVDCHVEY